MKALILAAGLGTRLAPATDVRPKSLVSVNGKPILFKQIENIISNNISDITVVAGYKAEILESEVHRKWKDIRIIKNKGYAHTNNMYSAWIGIKDMFPNGIGESFLMMNADVFFDPSVIAGLIECPSDNAIAVDVGRYMEESMKVVEQAGRLVEISKQINKADALGCSIDVYKFGIDGGKKFYEACNEYIAAKELKLWSEVALNKILANGNVTFMPCALKGRWVEIDNYEDLAEAEKLFANEV